MSQSLKSIIFILTAVFCLSLCGCSDKPAEQSSSAPSAVSSEIRSEEAAAVSVADESIFIDPDDPTEAYIGSIIESMSLEEKVGQMFLVRCPVTGFTEEAERFKFGGYVMFAKNFTDKDKQTVIGEISACQEKAKIKLLFSVDEEGGKVIRISSNPKLRETPFRSPQELYKAGGYELIASDTREKSELLLSLGINVNLAPVCDISTDPNDYIYERTFGGDTESTSKYVTTVVSNKGSVGCVLKHFPGYGNNPNTHTDVVHDNRPIEQFFTQDFVPFKAGIDAGADGVMVSHNIINCIDGKLPSSLSPKIHDILRHDLEFSGVIITDDLYMDAIRKYTDSKSAAVLAVKAGNDMLCCTDYGEQIPAVINAVKSGEITEARLNESLRRILRWKFRLGLI